LLRLRFWGDETRTEGELGWTSLAPGAHAERRPIEPCPDILARTIGLRYVTDDNMGCEGLHYMGLE